MAARSRSLREASGRYGRARQLGDDREVQTALRDLTAEKITAYVERVVAEAPPLTAAQRERIAAILTAPADGRRSAA